MAVQQRKPKKRPARKRKPIPMVRTSERTSYKGCMWAWNQGYNHRLKPNQEAPALRFGTLVHAALEVRYPPGIKRGPKPAETFEKLFVEELKEAERSWGFRDSDGEWADAGELGVNMLEHYVEVYGRDEEWKVIASEMTFQVPVYGVQDEETGLWLPAEEDEGDLATHLFNYVGTMDGVWESRMDGNLWVNDYKTTSGNPEKEAMGKLVLDEQGTAYWTWGVDYMMEKGLLKPRHRMSGMLYTFLRKGKKDPRPVNAEGQCLNQDGSVSKKQPQPYFHREPVYRDREQCDRARARAIHEFTEMQLRRQGKLPIYKSPGLSFPHQQCKGCAFFDLCELDEIGEDYTDLQKAAFREWDPYAAHEIKEEGKY